jgi:hypothetical protein
MRHPPTILALLAVSACASAPAPSDGGATDVLAAVESGGDAPAPDAPQGGDASAADATLDAGADAAPDASADAPVADTSTAGAFALPPENGGLDYQLGGAYTPPVGVTIVSRDHADPPARGLYNICYVNGFQIQPDELTAWMRDHPALILRDASGQPVVDPDWQEVLIDVSTAAKRAEAASVIGAWIDGCARAGFAAVEIDNLDSYTRSTGLLTADNAVAAERLFADRAHAAGLAIAQKNASELVPRRAEMGTDFVVAEECNHYHECDAYRASYGTHVLMIEYVRADFSAGCAAYPSYSIVLRDRNLVPFGASGYVFDGC